MLVHYLVLALESVKKVQQYDIILSLTALLFVIAQWCVDFVAATVQLESPCVQQAPPNPMHVHTIVSAI